jgi:hypothetical protein
MISFPAISSSFFVSLYSTQKLVTDKEKERGGERDKVLRAIGH